MSESQPRPVYFCECGDHAFAPLTKGFMAVVSPEDAILLHVHWHVHISRGYANIQSPGGGKFTLARVVVKAARGETVDHRSGDTMDNRRSNLRICTQKENLRNRRNTRGRELPKGVTSMRGRFRARIDVDNRPIELGAFDTVEEAHAAYREAAKLYHGEFARAA